MINLFFAIGLLTFSIFVHEFGHFLVARWRKLAVPRFSIFGIGNPIVSKKWRGVEYCVCWLPFGAYVMIPQLSDLGDFEGELPEEAQGLPPAPYTSKVMVALAGPLANIILAFLLACIVSVVGLSIAVEYGRTEIGEVAKELETTEGKSITGPAFAAGLKTGDVIRTIDGKPVSNFQDISEAVLFGSQISPDGRRVANVTFERDGTTIAKQIYPELTGADGYRTIGIGPRFDLVVETVSPDSPAAKAKLQPGDRILAVDGKPLTSRVELREHFQKKNSEISALTIKRGAETLTAQLQPRLGSVEGHSVYLIGIGWKNETEIIHPTPLSQIGDAYHRLYETFSSLLNRNSDIGVRHMNSIVGMVDNLQQVVSYGLMPAFSFLIVINIALATFNLLPIPVLDGGHVVLATLAKLRGRPLNPTWMQKAVTAC